MAKTQVTQVEASRIGRDKGGRWIFSLPPRGFTWQVREDILLYADPQDKGWERPRWENLFYFFRLPVVTWPNGLDVLGCLGDWGEREWKERGAAAFWQSFSILPIFSASFLVFYYLPPIPAGMSEGTGKIPLVLTNMGNVRGKTKNSPQEKKKKSLISETELPNEKYQVGRSCPINCSYYYLFQPYIPVIYGFLISPA